jgi:hypothetical protein
VRDLFARGAWNLLSAFDAAFFPQLELIMQRLMQGHTLSLDFVLARTKAARDSAVTPAMPCPVHVTVSATSPRGQSSLCHPYNESPNRDGDVESESVASASSFSSSTSSGTCTSGSHSTTVPPAETGSLHSCLDRSISSPSYHFVESATSTGTGGSPEPRLSASCRLSDGALAPCTCSPELEVRIYSGSDHSEPRAHDQSPSTLPPLMLLQTFFYPSFIVDATSGRSVVECINLIVKDHRPLSSYASFPPQLLSNIFDAIQSDLHVSTHDPAQQSKLRATTGCAPSGCRHSSHGHGLSVFSPSSDSAGARTRARDLPSSCDSHCVGSRLGLESEVNYVVTSLFDPK